MAAEKKLPIDVALATISTLSDLVRQDAVESSDVAVADTPKTRRDPIPLPPIQEPIEIQSVLRPMTAMEVMMRELNILRSRIDELEDDDGPDCPIQPSGASSVSPFRTWRPVVEGSTVHIYDAVLSRNGIRIQSDHMSTVVTASGWNDLYVALTSAAGDPSVKPTGMSLYSAPHPIASSDYSDTCIRCGAARLTGTTIDRIQVTKDNDHDNSVARPDSELIPTPTTKTLEVDPTTGGSRLFTCTAANTEEVLVIRIVTGVPTLVYEYIVTSGNDPFVASSDDMQAVASATWYEDDDATYPGQLRLMVATWTVANGRLNFGADTAVQILSSTGESFGTAFARRWGEVFLEEAVHDETYGVGDSTAHTKYWINTTAAATYDGQNFADSCGVNDIWDNAATPALKIVVDASQLYGNWAVTAGTSDDGDFSVAGELNATGNVNITNGSVLNIASTKVVANRVTGWTFPGGGDRTVFDAIYTAPDISDPPTEAEVQAIADHLQKVSKTLAQLLDDLGTGQHGLIGPTP